MPAAIPLEAQTFGASSSRSAAGAVRGKSPGLPERYRSVHANNCA